MSYRRSFILAFVALGALSATHAEAAITFYTSRATYLHDAAVAAAAATGVVGFNEGFDSFTQDKSFRTTSVAVHGGAFSQMGLDQNFRNSIDVLPAAYNGFGSSAASLYTNHAESGILATVPVFTFSGINLAFGTSTFFAGDGEKAIMNVYGRVNGVDTKLGSIDLADSLDAFVGYVLSNNDRATRIEFTSKTVVAGLPGEGFYLDDLTGYNAPAVIPLPEPTSFAAFGIGIAALIARRRKRA